MVEFNASGSFYASAGVRYRQNVETAFNKAELLSTASVSQSGSRKVVTYETVHFRNPADDSKSISVRLSSDLIERLVAKFGVKEIVKQDDGSWMLSGRAEKFVAGWYKEIAATRGYEAAGIEKLGLFGESDERFDQTRSAVRMEFSYLYEKETVQIDARVHSRYETLDDQKKILEQLDALKVEDLAKILRPEDFDTIAAPLALAKLSYEHHAAMIDLAETPFKTGSIEEALNLALEGDKDLNGEIDFDETVKMRYGPQMTSQELMSDLNDRYLASVEEVLQKEYLLPSHLRDEFNQSGYVPNPEFEGSQRLRIMSMDEIELLLERISELINKKTEESRKEEPGVDSQIRIHGLDVRV